MSEDFPECANCREGPSLCRLGVAHRERFPNAQDCIWVESKTAKVFSFYVDIEAETEEEAWEIVNERIRLNDLDLELEEVRG